MESFDVFTPMSAGDIIDRAVRLYRHNFLALLRIVLAPSLVAYAGLILYQVGLHNFSLGRGDFRLLLTIPMIVGGGLLYLIGTAAFFVVLGGVSHSLIHHFFDGTPLRARTVYQTVRERLWPLILAALVVVLMIVGFMAVVYLALVFLVFFFVALAAVFGGILPQWIRIISIAIFGLAAAAAFIAALLMFWTRIIYVPQVLVVEGKGVFSSINRSFSLADGAWLRFGALVLFWFYVGWSLLWMMLFPLMLSGHWMGVEISPFAVDEPFWFRIVQQTITQLSGILISPIAMLGFNLLYINSRVRKEGFDVELLANRVLLPPPYTIDPRQLFGLRGYAEPLIYGKPSSLGFNDYRPVDAGSPNLEDQAGELPLDLPKVESPVAESWSEVAPVGDMAVQDNVATVRFDAPLRICKRCGTEADVEDRFCRVCGSGF